MRETNNISQSQAKLRQALCKIFHMALPEQLNLHLEQSYQYSKRRLLFCIYEKKPALVSQNV